MSSEEVFMEMENSKELKMVMDEAFAGKDDGVIIS